MANNSNDFNPLVSVVLPVYNEELFIKETLEGILNQDYEYLEIIISDNHSSDGTASLCREFASRDQRIQFFQQASNVGVTANHDYLIRKAKGVYMILAAGHDKWSSNYISANVKAMENHPSVVLSYGTPRWIDETGLPFDRYSGWFDTRGMTIVSRFFFVFWGKPNPILGLIRRDKFPDLEGYNFVGADLVILCRLALHGEFSHTVNSIFTRRQNRQLEKHKERLERYTSEKMKINTSLIGSIFPLFRLPIELFRTVINSPITVLNKLAIILLLIVSIPIKYFTEMSENC